MECPWRNGGEANEAEQQTGACREPHKNTDFVATQAHHEPSMRFLLPPFERHAARIPAVPDTVRVTLSWR